MKTYRRDDEKGNKGLKDLLFCFPGLKNFMNRKGNELPSCPISLSTNIKLQGGRRLAQWKTFKSLSPSLSKQKTFLRSCPLLL